MHEHFRWTRPQANSVNTLWAFGCRDGGTFCKKPADTSKITQKELAAWIDYNTKPVYQTIACKTRITSEAAVRLERSLAYRPPLRNGIRIAVI
ncbi:MAG: hypothetical protein JWM11_5526 [Planctomycetaceae bacterium]|nr:hypothetical protein [Planctomycetaceae bacterium]